MKPSLKRLKTFIEHPATKLTTGLILFCSGIASVYTDITSTEHTLRFGVHHGVLFLGLVQILGSLPDLLDGVGKTIDVVEQRQVAENNSSSP